MLSRIIFLLFCGCLGLLFGQRGDTITYQLVTNATASGTSNYVRNIGQSQHLIWARYTDSGGTCNAIGGATNIYLEASYDAINFFSISPRQMQIQNDGVSATGSAMANGPYPFIRVRYGMFANCRLDIWYSGTVPTSAYPQIPKALSTGYAVSPSLAPTGPIVQDLVTNLDEDGRIAVYGVWLANLAATATIATVYFGDPGCDDGATMDVLQVKLAPAGDASSSFVLPNAFVPYGVGELGASLCLDLDAAGIVRTLAAYRIE